MSAGGDENSAKDTGLAIEQLDVIRRQTDPEVTREKTPVEKLRDNLPDSARLPVADDKPKWDDMFGACDDCGTSIPILFARIVGARPVRLVCRICARRWLDDRRLKGLS